MKQLTGRVCWQAESAPVDPQPMLEASPEAPLRVPPAAMSGLAGVVGEWWRARTQTARQLRLVETLPLGPKRSVALLELDGIRFLAGMGADGVTTLVQVQPGVDAA